MTGETNGAVLSQLHRLFHEGTVAGLGEEQLLERFVVQRDQIAFRALVARHGPMVLGVCRRILRDPRDVEDAFQATFLILVRKAAGIQQRELLGHWLHGVAYRVAVRSRASAAKIRTRETIGLALETTEDGTLVSQLDDLLPVLDEELNRLPEKFRLPIVLCHLEGQTHDEAANRLRCPVGTVRSRLARGRERLRARLIRRGLAPALLTGFGLTAQGAEAIVPPALLDSTIVAAVQYATARAMSAGILSSSAISLTQGVLKTMFLSKLKLVGAATVTASVVALAMAAPRSSRSEPQTGSTPPVASTTGSALVALSEREPPKATTVRGLPFDPQLEGAWRVVTVAPVRENGVPVLWTFRRTSLEQTVLTPGGRRTVQSIYTAKPRTIQAERNLPTGNWIEIRTIEKGVDGSAVLVHEGTYSIQGDRLVVVLNPENEAEAVQMNLQRAGGKVVLEAPRLAPVSGAGMPKTAEVGDSRSKAQEPLDPDKEDARKLLTLARQLKRVGRLDEAQSLVEIVRGMNLAWSRNEDAPENVSSAIQIERSMARQHAHEFKKVEIVPPSPANPPPTPASPAVRREPTNPAPTGSQPEAPDERHGPAPASAPIRGLERRLGAARDAHRNRTRERRQGIISHEAVQKSRQEVDAVLDEIDAQAEQASDDLESLEIELDEKKAALREAEARIKQGEGLIKVAKFKMQKTQDDRFDPWYESYIHQFEQPVLEAQRDGKRAALRDCELRLARARKRKAEFDRLKARVESQQAGAGDGSPNAASTDEANQKSAAADAGH